MMITLFKIFIFLESKDKKDPKKRRRRRRRDDLVSDVYGYVIYIRNV